MSRFRAPAEGWKIFSGNWVKNSGIGVRLEAEKKASLGESMAIIGPGWTDVEFRVSFKFLSDTIRPPDGGAIIFFLVRNSTNHLAFHCCVAKKRIQLFKRTRGIWTMLGENSFDFRLGREYDVQIKTCSGVHECRVDGSTIQMRDQH
jgi:hypothetical protein